MYYRLLVAGILTFMMTVRFRFVLSNLADVSSLSLLNQCI